MQKIDFQYQQECLDGESGQVAVQEFKHSFFFPTKPKELTLRRYAQIMVSIVKMPLFARVLLGFVSHTDVETDFKEERFFFHNCSLTDKLALYESIECFLLAAASSTDAIFTSVYPKDFVFLRQLLTADECENFTMHYLLYLATVIAQTFSAINPKDILKECLEDSKKTGQFGKNVIKVAGEDYYLPAAAVKELAEIQLQQSAMGLHQWQQKVAQLSNADNFADYNVWELTTAIEFYSLTPDFNLLYKSNELSNSELMNDSHIAQFMQSNAAVFAHVARKITHINPITGAITTEKLKQMNINELSERSNKLIALFMDNLDMQQAYCAYFFFLNTMLNIKKNMN